MALPVTAELLRSTSLPPGALDPNVKIPRAVREAGRRSEEVQRASLGIAEPSVAEAAARAAEAAGTPQAPGGGEVPPISEPPVTPPGNPQPETPEPPPPQEGEPVDWEQRYKRLQGRHEADARRNRDAISQLSNRLDQVERENQSLRVAAPAPVDPQAPPQSLISDQEIQDYGPELVDVMRRVAAETAAPLNAEIGRLRSAMGHVQQETGNVFQNRMNDTIKASIPRWAEINADARFIAWSQLPDIFSGAIRKELMQEAWDSGDANRCIAFFQAFLAEEAALNPSGGRAQPSTAPRTALTPPAAPAVPQLDLASLAAPGRAHSAGGAPAEKPVYTTAEITRFYTDVASGKWRGREQQQAAIDADIILAQREGRIIINPRTQLPIDPRQSR